MSGHEQELIAFLAGDLDPDRAQRIDAHLLRCESCWAAVCDDRQARGLLEQLRDPPPPGLADRLSLAVQVASHSHQRSPRRRPARWAGLAIAVVGALAGVLVAVFSPVARSASPAVAAVVRFAQLIPPSPSTFPGKLRPTALGRPTVLTAGGQPLELSYYQLGGVEAVVASSPRQFSMPPNGRAVGNSGGMAWSATRSGITLFCLNGSRPILLAAHQPLAQLQALAAQLHLP
jgi:hypothetical protein